MKSETRQYQDLRYKTVISLDELDKQMDGLKAFTKKIKTDLNTGQLKWDQLGDLNRLKVALNEFTFLPK